jgi:hypothetical protein
LRPFKKNTGSSDYRSASAELPVVNSDILSPQKLLCLLRKVGEVEHYLLFLFMIFFMKDLGDGALHTFSLLFLPVLKRKTQFLVICHLLGRKNNRKKICFCFIDIGIKIFKTISLK